MAVILRLQKKRLYLSTIAVLFTLLPLAQLTSFRFAPSLIAGCILSILNAFLGYVVIEQSFKLNDRQFIIVSLGGFVVRFFAMIVAVAAVVIVARVNVLVFILSLLCFYVVFMAVEVAHINHKIEQMKPAKAVARSK